MWVSIFVLGLLIVIFGVSYFQMLRAIEQDDINEAITRVERLKNKRMSSELAGS